MKCSFDVLKKFADDIADRIVRKTVVELKGIEDTLSAEDSNLENAWEEICAQVQLEQSHFWEAYEDTAGSIISRLASKLKYHELLAIWFQTDDGEDWDGAGMPVIVMSREHFDQMSASEQAECRRNKCRVEDDDPPLCIEDVERYIQSRLFDKAGRYSNGRIKRFLKRYD